MITIVLSYSLVESSIPVTVCFASSCNLSACYENNDLTCGDFFLYLLLTRHLRVLGTNVLVHLRVLIRDF